MNINLVVINPFASYSRGDLISDPTAILAAINTNPSDVIRVNASVGGVDQSKVIAAYSSIMNWSGFAEDLSVPSPADSFFAVWRRDQDIFTRISASTVAVYAAQSATGIASRLGQIATRCVIPGDFLASNKQLMSRTVHTLRDNAGVISLAFPNWHCKSGFGEQAVGGLMTLTVGIEYPLGSTPRRLTFGGSDSVIIADLTTAWSDAFALGGVRGEQFAVKTYQTNTAGIIFSGTRNGVNEGYNAGTSGVADNTLTTVNPTGPGVAYTPAAIVGDTNLPAILIVGDSKALGVGESTNLQDPGGLAGEIERSVGRDIAFINTACSSDKVNVAVAGYTRRAELAAYCTHVVSNYGINDLGAGRSAAQVLNDIQSLSDIIGKPFWQATIAPFTTSTDGWTTTGGQTVWDATKSAQRIALNNSLRKVPRGLSGIFDIADVLESTRDSGLWSPNITSDGLHENVSGYYVLETSGVISPEKFFRLPVLY